jgi:hypothetical protein
MVAKNKRASRIDTEVPVHDVFGLRLRASQHHEDLLEEARSLRAAGKIREARGVEKRAGQVEQLMGALDAEARQPVNQQVKH